MADESMFTNPMDQGDPWDRILLKKARRSVGGMLTSDVKPGQSMLPNARAALDPRQRAAELYAQGEELYNAEPDMSQLQAFARQRGEQGNAAMLNALAAQFAGEGFAPVQAQFLKRAAAAQDPIKMGSGLITSDGQFIKDPEAAQNKKAEFLLQQAKAYETLAQTAETARERLRAEQLARERDQEYKRIMAGIAQQSADTRALVARNATLQQAQAANERKDKQLSEGTANLSKRADDYVNLVAGVRELNNMLGNYVPEGKSIPGVGFGSDISVLGLDIGGLAAGTEGKSNRALVKNVANELLRAASGQAVTLNEYERQTLSNMAAGRFSEKDFLNAYQNVVLPKVNEAVSNLGGGFSQEVKDRYRSQGGKIDFSQPFVAPQRRDAKQSGAPAGVDPKIWAAMTPEERALWK